MTDKKIEIRLDGMYYEWYLGFRDRVIKDWETQHDKKEIPNG